MSDLLNAYQRNALIVALRAFEEQLHQFNEWMQRTEQVGILYHRRLSLSSSERAQIQSRVAESLDCIAELAVRFNLESQEENAAAGLRAGAGACWATLCDVRADKLKRYGKVHPKLALALSPSIETLIGLSFALSKAMGSDSPDQKR